MIDHIDKNNLISQNFLLFIIFLPSPRFESIIYSTDTTGIFIEKIKYSHNFIIFKNYFYKKCHNFRCDIFLNFMVAEVRIERTTSRLWALRATTALLRDIIWCQWVELNHRPQGYESCALPLSYIGKMKILSHKLRIVPIILLIANTFCSNARVLYRKKNWVKLNLTKRENLLKSSRDLFAFFFSISVFGW